MLSLGVFCGVAAAEESVVNVQGSSDVVTVAVTDLKTIENTDEVIFTEDEEVEESNDFSPSSQLAKLQAAIEAANAVASEQYDTLINTLADSEEINANISATIAKIENVTVQAAEDKAALDAALSGTVTEEVSSDEINPIV
ncbi:hypothetical protein ACKUB1_12530 [Methanospirillum stamsii]|nr:hypothetical protein [Methanospirillum stamsii]